jgi:PAS domain S-box-containing protein
MNVNDSWLANTPPVRPPDGELRTRSNGSVTAGGDRKANILMVDDRPEKLLALEAVLGSLNQNLIRAKSGKDALRHLLKEQFAVILLDVAMPGMDGFETASLIRKRPQTEHTPIIFITSINDTENHIAQGYSLGAVDYMLTPIVPEVLKAKVAVFVDLYRKTEQVREQSEQLRELEEVHHRRQLADAVDRLETETRRNRFFSLAVDMLAIAGFDGYFKQLNPTWHKVLGFPEEELKARPLLEFVHKEDYAATKREISRLSLGSTTEYFENRYHCSDGTFRWIGWTAAPFPAERLVYIFARDITAQKQAEVEIQHLNQQLNQRVSDLVEVNKELEAFNYSISHDLRGPLRSMQGFASALLEECESQLGEIGREYALRIVNSGRYMDTLLRDLLAYSRLTAAELTLAPVELNTLLADVIEQFQNEIQEKSAVIQIDPSLDCVLGHASTLRHIFANLIGNALKFIEGNTRPRVHIFTESGADSVRIWVEDNGIGIAAEHQSRIFGLFERLHSGPGYSGTGVGLAIVRKGAERMGGRAGVDSKVGKGSRFWIELAAVTKT